MSKYNIGGKTGSTNNLRSTWFIGYSPNLVTGVYVGFDSNESLGKREYAVKTALPIWAEFMSRSLPSRPVEDFREPEGIQWRLIDEKTGLLSKKSLLEKYTGELFEDEINPKSVTPPDGTILEAFIENSEPTEYSQEENGESQIDFFDEGGL